jgi:hypothetical protein
MDIQASSIGKPVTVVFVGRNRIKAGRVTKRMRK